MKELRHQQHMEVLLLLLLLLLYRKAAEAAVLLLLLQLPIPYIYPKIYIENICLGLVLTHAGVSPLSPYGIEL